MVGQPQGGPGAEKGGAQTTPLNLSSKPSGSRNLR